ncbi:MAG: wax ester/triacylglycerol synthase family O-acyltransferase [Myxococcota bacterium]|nr:wax ester/triacylglycerol synthase family O-acyltransferase [Myxococcota bacterium]
MSPQDASFLHVENDVNHMHIASVAIFEGPPPTADEIAGMVASKLHRVPRYRQRVRFVPLELGRPVWVDDPHFNLRYHLRHTALPRPGGLEALRALVGRVMAQQLDRAKPLWEMWIAEGLEGDRWALLSKTHHCMVDGVSGTDLLTVILDAEPDVPRETPPPWSPQPSPGDAELLRDALQERLVRPREILRGLRAATRVPRRAAEGLRELAPGARTLGRLLRPGAETSLNGPIGPHRRWDFALTTLADVKRIRAGLGGTVNDVVLAAITRGFRDLLLSRGEPVDGRVVRTLVPVSVRREDERGTYNNRVSAMFAELPVGEPDPRQCLEAIRVQMEGLKERREAVAAEVLTSLAGFAPPLLLALGGRVFARAPQRNVQTVTTNVPGPQQPVYACGRRMLHAMPYVPLAGSVRIGIAIFSYAGELAFGATGDWDSTPDLDVLCRGIREGMEELLKAAA